MSSLSAGKIAAGIASVAALSLLGYAVYFDYRRRSDPDFRLYLQKQRLRVERLEAKQFEEENKKLNEVLKEAVKSVAAEKQPADPKARESYFLENVALGEQLAMRSPELYTAAATSFFKALKVYPNPTDLMTIYQRTQPQPVFNMILEMLAIEIKQQA